MEEGDRLSVENVFEYYSIVLNSLEGTLSHLSLRYQLGLFQLLGPGCINNGFLQQLVFYFLSNRINL